MNPISAEGLKCLLVTALKSCAISPPAGQFGELHVDVNIITTSLVLILHR